MRTDREVIADVLDTELAWLREHLLDLTDKILAELGKGEYCQCEMKDSNGKGRCIICRLPINFNPTLPPRKGEYPCCYNAHREGRKCFVHEPPPKKIEELDREIFVKLDIQIVVDKINQLCREVSELIRVVNEGRASR